MDSLPCQCQSASTTEADPAEMIEKLDTIIHSVEVRIKSLEYQQTQHTLRAKQLYAEQKTLRCKAELALRHEKSHTYARFVNLLTNVCRIRHSIDSTQSYEEIASHMGLANKVLEEALNKVDPERIDDLMDQLNDNSVYVREVGNALGRAIEDDFDEEQAMVELQEEIELPDVPTQAKRSLVNVASLA